MNSIRKVYLCDSDDVHDVGAWKVVKTSNKLASITKGEMMDMVKIVQDEFNKANAMAKYNNDPKVNPTGNSWSAQLQRKNAPSRWITYRGNRILIKLNSDGTGTVVFSANPSMEHLRIIPKTHEEYKKIAKEKDKLQAKRRVKEEATEKEVKEARERGKMKKQETASVKQSYRERLADIFGKERDEEVTEEDVKSVEKKLEKKAERMIEREEEKQRRKEAREAMKELMEVIDGVGETVKDKVEKAIEDIAEKKIADEVLGETGFFDDEETLQTGNDEADKKLDLVRSKITMDDAIDIINAKEKKKEALKEVKAKYKDEVSIPKGNIEITSLQGVAEVDWDAPVEAAEEQAIESALKSIETKNRADLNTELYKQLEGRDGKKSTQKEMAKGAKDTINAMAGEHLEGASLSDEIIEAVGVQNASRLVAGAIAKELSDKELNAKIKEIEKFLGERSQQVVSDVVGTVSTKQDRIKNYSQQAEDGMLADATARALNAQQYGSIGRELGLSVGSLEAAATVLDSLRDVKESKGDIIVDMGNNIANIKDKLSGFGLSEDDYFTKKDGGKYEVTIKHEAFSKMMSEETFSNQRDATVEAIKTGAAIEGEIINEKMGLRSWRPKGTEATFVDFKTKKEFNELSDEKKAKFKPYINKKGERGYSSQFKEGTTLYGTDVPIGSMDAQQKAIKYGLSQKRTVWNLGAGTGKTFSYLGMVSELKAQGKEGFSLISPPSRLRDEFLKDTEKFFPHLKTATLDGKDMSQKMQILQDAKDGKYDIVFSGHDSVKSKLKPQDLNPIIEKKTDERLAEWQKSNPDATPHETRKMRRDIKGDAVSEFKDYGLPNVISDYKPMMVAVDEAHEVFKSHEAKDSLKFSAIKKLQEGTEYVVNGTGTTVKNNMNELGNLLHVTNPDEFPSPSAFGKKYADVNQGSTVYQSQAAEAMAREYDNVMLTEKLDLKPNYIRNEKSIEVTPEQKKAYAESERQYRLDRDSVGYGIVDHNTGNLILDGDGLKKWDDIGFQPSKDPSKLSAKDKAFLKANGYEPSKSDGESGHTGYSIVKLGKQGAAGRRQSRHEKVVNGGDHKTNAKAISMRQEIESKPANEKHIIYYDRHQSREMLNSMLKDMGVSPEQVAHVHGKVGAKQRKNAVTSYQTDPNVRFMLASTAGMTGLNLQQGDNQHFLTRLNTYATEQQAGARSYRTGREKDVYANFYDSKTPLDDRKVDTINRKKRMTESIKETRARNLKKLKEKKGIKKGIYVKF